MRSSGKLRSLAERHRLGSDAALAAGLLALSVGSLTAGLGGTSIDWLWAVLLTVPLVWRRRHPSAVFALMAVCAFGQWLTGTPNWADAGLLVALYTVAATEPRGRLLVAAAVMEVGAVLAVVRWVGHGPALAFIFLSGMVVAAAALGRATQVRRSYLRSLEERAVRLEHERDQQGQIAAAAERARITRELHDIVAHNVSVMTALASGAGYAVKDDPDEAIRMMDLSASTGREALADMRRLLGVLGPDEDSGRAPQPGTDDLPVLLEQVRSAGLPVTLTLEGRPDDLPAGAQLTLFRLIQESLTNSLKHAGPAATAAIGLRYRRGEVELEILDTGVGGRAAPSPRAQPGQGRGLTGMRERAAAYGGAVEAGPRQGGGWRVATRLSVPDDGG
jgi:signal transduction histidine kinase